MRELSSVAPIGDLVFGFVILLIAVVAANLAIIPRLFSHNAVFAKALLLVSVVGSSAAVIALQIQPRQIYLVVGIYIFVFMLLGYVLAWRSIGWRQAAVRVLLGSLGMLLALSISHWLAYAPR